MVYIYIHCLAIKLYQDLKYEANILFIYIKNSLHIVSLIIIFIVPKQTYNII